MALTAREHLHNLVASALHSSEPKLMAEAIHAAANFLSVPEPKPLEPKAFQQALCLLLKSRADAQNLPAKGVKRERAYIEGLMGAGMALQVLGSDQLNPFLILASLGTIRGAVDAVDAVAQGKPLP